MAKRKIPTIHSDFGSSYRSQHGPVVVEGVPADMQDTTNKDRARAIETDDPLYIYRRNRTISVRQRDAGLVLRELWNRTGLEPRTVGHYSDMISRGSVESLHIKSVDQFSKYLAAMRSLTPNVAAVVVAVVCMQERVARRRVAKLKHGLTRLQRHFGT